MIVRVLGSAAGGGLPQWNCSCHNCAAARAEVIPRRSTSSIAVSLTGERWWLVNVSPDVASQIEAFAPLQPRAGRGTPIAGMLLTDANIDHIGGFAVLRQTGEHRFAIYSTQTVSTIAATQDASRPFQDEPHVWTVVAPESHFVLEPGLDVRVIRIDGLTPGYAGRKPLPDAVVAYAITDVASGGSALIAPVFAEVGEPLLRAARQTNTAFFDGSFWSDDELTAVGLNKSARSLGHIPVAGLRGSLARLRQLPPGARRFYTHINNTNPMLDPTSDAHRAAAAAGLDIAHDGLELRL